MPPQRRLRRVNDVILESYKHQHLSQTPHYSNPDLSRKGAGRGEETAYLLIYEIQPT